MTTPSFDVEGPVLAELFVLYADDEGIWLTGPCGAAPWQLEVAAGDDPMPVAREVATRVLGEPLLLHSTSWRRDKNAVMLSFVTVVDKAQVAEYRSARRRVARAPHDVRPRAVPRSGLTAPPGRTTWLRSR